MAYVDGSKCSSFNVIRKRPPTLVWTSELLREREDEELNSGGFGFGEIEGPFVEQEDPMPDNIEGFFWKLNKHINSIITEKTGFEKTLDAAEYMFPRKLEGFFERYVDALKYQGCRKEGERVISLRDEHADIGMDQEGTIDKNILGSPTLYNMGPETHTLENELVDKLSNENRFGSPSLYNMGPETQEEVLRSVDDVDATIKRRKWFDTSDIPSFSLGVTQDFAHLDEDVVTPVANTHEPNLACEISNPLPLRPIPFRVCPPGTAVGRLRRDKDKRPITISEVRKSPFIGRVVDADGSLSGTEKRITKYLFEVLEDHRSKESPFRMFLPTFVVNNTVYNNLLGHEGRFQSFMGYVVNAIENKGKYELLKDIDVIFILVDNGGHKFLFVADFKNSHPFLIDHEKNEKIVRKRVKKKIGTCDNITVATMLHGNRSRYLCDAAHEDMHGYGNR
nr:C2 calcium-dependent membrane targeting [Tanacetum cinerariifolium]